jgi:hypothetical protein
VEEQHSPRKPDKPEDDKKKVASDNKDLWRLLGLGIQLAVTVGLFVALGWWLEEKHGWPSWSRIAISTFGIVVGLYHFVKESSR